MILGQIVQNVNAVFDLLYNKLKVIKMYDRIRDIRKNRDLTQQYVAKKIMCDQSLYSKYERGEREIPLKIIIKLADYYDISIDYLVGRASSPKRYK